MYPLIYLPTPNTNLSAMVKSATSKEKGEMLFNFFDISRSGFIEKEEFIKMLYNYPKLDIMKFLGQIDSASMEGSPSYEMLEELEKGSPSDRAIKNQFFSLADFKNGLKSARNISIVNLGNVEASPRKKNNSLKLPHKKNLPRSAQFKPYKKYYTTMNNTIKYIAEVVYAEIGEGEARNQMSLDNFYQWISINEGILSTFDKWLRKSLWSQPMNEGPTYRVTPNLKQSYAKVNLKAKAKKVGLKMYNRNFVELYNGLIFIYKDSSGEDLKKVILLKTLDITFHENEKKIKVFHPECKKYVNLTMVFESGAEFLKWKVALTPYLGETVDEVFQFCEKIGKGNFSTVNKGFKRTDHSLKVAIKTIIKKSLKPEENELISQECQIMQKLSHPNIIKFIEKFEDVDKLYYIFELVEGGDLYDYVLKKNRLEEEESRAIMKQLLDVVGYLHLQNIMHRDLKPENIMVLTDDLTGQIAKIKLIDFGFSTYFTKDDLPTMSCGTLNYAAPEVLLGDSYDESSDVFSIGVILYML